MEELDKLYHLHIYFAHTGPLKLHNVSEKGLKDWNEKLLTGQPFVMNIGNVRPYFFNSEYIIHTEVYVQKIGEFSDDPRREGETDARL